MSRVLILSQMSRDVVILEDYCLFELYSESFIIPLFQAPETDSKHSLVEVSPYQVEALRTKTISRRLIDILTQQMYVLERFLQAFANSHIYPA